MTRTRFVVLAGLVFALGFWLLTRNGRTATAAEFASEPVALYGANTEEVALDRWAHGAPRHWRHLMVKR